MDASKITQSNLEPLFIKDTKFIFLFLVNDFGFGDPIVTSKPSVSRLEYNKKNIRLTIEFYYRNTSIGITIFKKNSKGEFKDTNDWKNTVLLYHLILQKDRNFDVSNLTPYNLSLEDCVKLNSELLKEYVSDILNEKKWISIEDVLGKPIPNSEIPIQKYYKFPKKRDIS